MPRMRLNAWSFADSLYPPKLPVQLIPRQKQHRRPAVGTAQRAFGVEQVIQEALHFGERQRVAGLERGAAGGAGADALAQASQFAPQVPLADVVDQVAQKGGGVDPLE